MWGLLLVDIARHVQRAYAREAVMSEEKRSSYSICSKPKSSDRHGHDQPAVATGSLTMPINILMPARRRRWKRATLPSGSRRKATTVKSGDVIAEIETDKVTMEVEAVDEGTIAKIRVPEGTADVPVNDVIAILAGDGEDVKAAASAGGGAAAHEARRRTGSRCTGARRCSRTISCSCRESSAASRRSRTGTRRAGQWRRPHLLRLGAPSGERRRHRSRPYHRHGAARPRDSP